MTQREANKLFKKSLIKVPLFDYDVYLSASKDDYIAKHKWLTGQNIDISSYGRCQAYTLDDGRELSLIGIFEKDLGVIAHECCHIALYICDRIGHKVSQDDEILPYLMQFLMDEVNSKMGIKI